eukprot:TRINITY_DN3051_c0_g1_i1.p1 TRINITY_DN3051_c0_g1~~TRINITY_DN3051_c0_g1_i1.p1  ORF type:complete len:295 (-),score=78.54 TRINITY_DN3051_c0_g1_i1:80-964(-)
MYKYTAIVLTFLICYSTASVPLLAWSNGYFSGNNVHVQGSVSVNDIEFFLNALTSGNAKQVESSLNAQLSKSNPDLVVLFLESELSADQVSFYSGAHGQSNGHALSNLRQAMESHTSFVSTNFAVDGSLDAALARINAKVVKAAKLADVKKALSTSSKVLVVELTTAGADVEATFAAHDQLVSEVMALVAEKSQGFVAVYTGKSDVSAHLDVEWEVEFASYMMEETNTNGTNTTTINTGFLHYFPGGQLQNIVIVMLFIAIALLGVCLIDGTQTHDRFAEPGQGLKNKEINERA